MNSDPSEVSPPAPEKQSTQGSRWREILRFLLVGATNTLIAYSLYLVLLLFLPYLFAYSVAYVCGIFVSYYLNARFVFNERLRVSRALQYPLVYVVQYVAGVAVLYLLVELLRLSKVVAPFLVALLMIPIAYHLSRYIIKRQSRRAVSDPRLEPRD